jgi:hypothetical protein
MRQFEENDAQGKFDNSQQKRQKIANGRISASGQFLKAPF